MQEVYIDLTADQVKALRPLFSVLMEMAEQRKPGALILIQPVQVKNGGAVASAIVLPHDVALGVKALIELSGVVDHAIDGERVG